MSDTAATIPAKPEITFDEFAKVDLRVATIVSAELHPNADKLLKLQLDDGSGTSSSDLCRSESLLLARRVGW